MSPDELLIYNLCNDISSDIHISTKHGSFAITAPRGRNDCRDIVITQLLDQYCSKYSLTHKKRKSSPNTGGRWTYYQRIHRTNGVADVRWGVWSFYNFRAPVI